MENMGDTGGMLYCGLEGGRLSGLTCDKIRAQVQSYMSSEEVQVAQARGSV